MDKTVRKGEESSAYVLISLTWDSITAPGAWTGFCPTGEQGVVDTDCQGAHGQPF